METHTKSRIFDSLYVIFLVVIIGIALGFLLFNQFWLGKDPKVIIYYGIVICIAIIGLILWKRKRKH